ncbi:MAG: DNA translocase FtsK [Chloroflexi bacterium]|nr:DNA translocase FtsK [Chloroflexota bacterium]
MPIFILGGASILLVTLGVALYVAWESVSATGLQVWEALRYTWAALAVWAAALPVTLVQRRDMVKRHPHRWLAALLMVVVAAGCLQLWGQGLGGTLGGWIIGPSAGWGIVRTTFIFAAALAIAMPAPALWASRILLIALGFLAVYLWEAMGFVLRWAQAAGVWIGLKCTAVSPSLARGAATVWRGVCAVYNKLPIHLYILAFFVIVSAAILRRPASSRRRARPVASGYEPYPYPVGVFENVGSYGETTYTPQAPRPAQATVNDLPRYESPSYLRPDAAPTPAAAYANGMLTVDEDDEDEVDVMSVVAEDIDEPEEVDAETDEDDEEDGEEDSPPFDLYDDELDETDDEDDDLDDTADPEVIDLRSGSARTGGSIAATATKWELPPLDLLKSVTRKEISDDVHQETARLIEQTLAEYNIEVQVKEIRPGPVVTQYGVGPGWIRRYKDVRERNPDGTPARGADGKLVSKRVEEKTRVRVDHVLAREKDLALALAAPSLRFEAPVPGESFMGLEVPNAQRDVVTLRSSLESSAFQAIQKKAKLPVALGLGSGGEPVIMDLADMPHLLIAGSTGSGKSVCMNTIICSLMMQCTPMDLQMYLVDPKRVELTAYNGLPHLTAPVLVEVDQAVPALHALIAEMQHRYKKFEARGARNIATFNGKLVRGEERMPYLMLVIDELADLMMTASGDVEHALCRLAQLGRATGIHLVVATQRPSVDVLTGLIKANFPSRMSFAVSSQVDSRTVLDSVGAEKLLGRGDLLFLPTNAVKPKRLQGAFISDEEVDAIVDFWQKQGNKPKPAIQMEIASPDNEEDTMLQEAQKLAINHSRISASLLQRKLGIGYAKAASLLDHLEDRGIVGPGDPGKSREVITPGG